jgi:dephospho-CoA kinase
VKPIIGLTGQTGAGKTSICPFFERLGFAVINADKVSREVTVKGVRCLDELVKVFGREILTECGELNRRKLGGIVFGNKEKLNVLNGICFPYITQYILKLAEEFGDRPVLLDAPVLFESGMNKICGRIISVIADYEVRKMRIMERDNLTKEEAHLRCISQFDDRFYIARSDFVIRNNGTLEQLQREAQKVAKKITEEQR